MVFKFAAPSTGNASMTMPFLFCAAITTISALISLGFSLAALMQDAGAARTAPFYTVSRSLAFAIIAMAALLNGSRPWLEAVAIGMVIVQAGDAMIGLTLRDRMKTFGPAGTATVNLAALLWLIR